MCVTWAESVCVTLQKVCVCVCQPRTQATSTPSNGCSQHGLLPTPGVTQAFVFLLPASCLLKTFHWPPANDTKLVQKGKKGETALGPQGDLFLLQGKDLWATARERGPWFMWISAFLIPQQASSPIVLISSLVWPA